MKTDYFECECQSPEHLLHFKYDYPTEVELENGETIIWDDLYVDVHLNNHLSFFKRLIIGIKYILGIPTGNVGHFELAIIPRNRIQTLIDMLEKIKTYSGGNRG